MERCSYGRAVGPQCGLLDNARWPEGMSTDIPSTRGRAARAGMAARGRAAQAGPFGMEGYDRQGGGVEKRRGARTLGGPSL